jgi:hypothetical protein
MDAPSGLVAGARARLDEIMRRGTFKPQGLITPYLARQPRRRLNPLLWTFHLNEYVVRLTAAGAEDAEEAQRS